MSNCVHPLIIAHRGASADFVENTRDAFIGASKQGADWVELDARLASDGGLIVNHDPWYHDKRTVWDTPSQDRPNGMLTLGESLDACAEFPSQHTTKPVGVNVEIKNMVGDLGGDHVPYSLDVVDAVLACLADRDSDVEILISSFDAATIERVRFLDGPPTALLVFDADPYGDVARFAADAGHVALNPIYSMVDETLVGQCKALGLAVNVWTVDDGDRIRGLADLCVDGIVTNTPRSARAALSE